MDLFDGNRVMRRKDKEILDRSEIEAILRRAVVCRLALADENGPYVVPLCFGYHDNSLYFHTAKEGRKLDMLKKDNRVCFEVDVDPALKKGDRPCRWTMGYQSVIGFGNAFVVESPEHRREGLDVIMAHYGGAPGEYMQSKMDQTMVVKVEIAQMTAKRSG